MNHSHRLSGGRSRLGISLRPTLPLWGLFGVLLLSATVGNAALPGADNDLYINLPRKLPAGEWKSYLGEIGSDTVASFKLGPEGKPQSTIAIVWFQELYNTRAGLEKAAPALKKLLATKVHKGDTAGPEKLPAAIFGLKGDEKDGSLVIFCEFNHPKKTDDREAGLYRYYYIFKPIDENTSISIGVEVQIHDSAHTEAINSLLFSCAFRTPAEVAAEAAAAAAKPAKPPVPGTPATPPTPATPETPGTPVKPQPEPGKAPDAPPNAPANK